MLLDEDIVNDLPWKENNRNLNFDKIPIKTLLMHKYFSLTN